MAEGIEEESFGERSQKDQVIYLLNCILFASKLMKVKFEEDILDYENVDLSSVLDKFENLYIDLDETLNYLNKYGKID